MTFWPTDFARNCQTKIMDIYPKKTFFLFMIGSPDKVPGPDGKDDNEEF